MNKFINKLGSILGLDKVRSLISSAFIGYYTFVDYDCLRLIEEAYKRNVAAYTCIDWIAQKLTEAPLTIYHKVPGKEKSFQKFLKWRNSTDVKERRKAQRMIGTEVEEITEHPLLDMLQKRQNPTMKGSLFLKGLTVNLLATGNGFALGIAPDSAPRKYREVYLLPPQHMKPAANSQLGDVLGWRFDLLYDKVIPTDDVLHVKYIDPEFTAENPYIIGLSPLVAAARSIDASNKGDIALGTAYENGGAQGILFGKGKTIDEKQRQELQNNINKKLSGIENYKAIAAASNEVGYLKLSDTIVDLNIVEAGINSDRKVANVFHLKSEVVLNDKDGATYNNMVEGRKACITDGVFPVQSMVEDCLTEWLVPGWFNGDSSYYIAFDRSVYPEMQPDMKTKMEWLDKAWMLSPNQKLVEMDYATSDDPLMDKIYVPNNLTPLEDLGLNVSDIGFETEIDDGQESNK